jgi:phage tail protein X
LAGGIADQVLPDFNYGIGKAALRAVLPQAIALELP